MSKGMNRADATRIAKPYKAGVEFLKASPLLLLAVANPGFVAMPFAVTKGVKNEKLNAVRNTMGDENAKQLNSKFESELSSKGYNAYRDSNDRRVLRTKESIVVINPEKNVKLDSSHKLTKSEYAQAYATDMQKYGGREYKKLDRNDLVKDGESN